MGILGTPANEAVLAEVEDAVCVASGELSDCGMKTAQQS
jgi:hypothetical protein